MKQHYFVNCEKITNSSSHLEKLLIVRKNYLFKITLRINFEYKEAIFLLHNYIIL